MHEIDQNKCDCKEEVTSKEKIGSKMKRKKFDRA